jgi:hypothetical protein
MSTEDATGDKVATLAELEGRLAAQSALIKSVLTTLMLRGLLTRAEIAPLIAEAEALMTASGAAAKAELGSIERDLPTYLREAMGPAPDEDDHDH